MLSLPTCLSCFPFIYQFSVSFQPRSRKFAISPGPKYMPSSKTICFINRNSYAASLSQHCPLNMFAVYMYWFAARSCKDLCYANTCVINGTMERVWANPCYESFPGNAFSITVICQLSFDHASVQCFSFSVGHSCLSCGKMMPQLFVLWQNGAICQLWSYTQTYNQSVCVCVCARVYACVCVRVCVLHLFVVSQKSGNIDYTATSCLCELCWITPKHGCADSHPTLFLDSVAFVLRF